MTFPEVLLQKKGFCFSQKHPRGRGQKKKVSARQIGVRDLRESNITYLPAITVFAMQKSVQEN